jgi:hypothetical protein
MSTGDPIEDYLEALVAAAPPVPPEISRQISVLVGAAGRPEQKAS